MDMGGAIQRLAIWLQRKHTLKKCFFQGNYYLLDNYDYESKSWGFCSDECFLEESTDKIADLGILRMKDKIHVLPEKLCEKYLEYSLHQTPEVEDSQARVVLTYSSKGETSDHVCGQPESVERGSL